MMDAARERAEEVFSAALELKDAGERGAFVERACAGDDALRQTVLEWLARQSDVQRFFGNESPGREIASKLAGSLPEIAGTVEHSADKGIDDGELGKSVGPYKLLQRIGEGGCGVVYMAEQEVPVRRRVALKIIKLGMDTKSVIARFEAERQALALMDHPNIARVLDAGSTGTGRPYFVMELVRGVKITAYCDEKRLDTRQRLELFTQVCGAIQHAHQKGVIHRDVKPSNVLVTSNDGVPVPKVIDFGIAKATGGQVLTDQTIFTAFEQFVGTPAYMSPEQAEWSELDVDTRSDVYSLGVLLYELLTGKTPFDQSELMQAGIDSMRRTLRERDPHRPSTKLDGLRLEELTRTANQRQAEPARLKSLLSGDLDWIVMKALEKDRNRRYQTANGLAADVRRFLDDEPVVARPPSRLYRLRKLARRNRGVFAAGSAVALALAVGFGVSTWMFLREREAREIAGKALANEAMLRKEAEAQARITEAAIFISRDRLATADERVDGIDLPVMKPSLEAANVFRTLADWHVTEGRWAAAAERLLKLVQASQIDRTDMTDAATRELLKVGPVLVLIGATNEYDAFYHEVITRFSGTDNPVATEHLIKASTLLTLDAETVRQLEPLVPLLEEFTPDPSRTEPRQAYMTAWRAFALARFHFRRGDFANADRWCERCLAYRDETPTRVVSTHLLRAMALQKLGDRDRARLELETARRRMVERFSTPLEQGLPPGNSSTGFWYDWVEAHLLLKEALLEIEGPALPPDARPPVSPSSGN